VDRARAAEQSTVAEAARADALAKSAANALVAHAQSVADLDAQAAREAEGAQYDGGRPLAAFAEGLRAEAAAVDGREAVLNDADSAARAATAALGDALQRAQSHADQSQAARTQLTQSQHKRDAAAEELARRTTALETERRGVLDALRAIDILDDDVHVGLTTLQARALRVAEARARLSDADAAFAQADDALKAAQSQWAAAELELTNATARVDTAREAEVAARAAAQSYLGGVHPAEVRGQLEGALTAAHAALVAHAERVSQAQAAAARAEERLGHATAAVETAQAAALAARVARDGAFDACGVADAASVEAASLDAGQRAALTTLRTRLMSALTEAESRHRSQSESLSAHWATRPAGEQGELDEAAARLEDAQAVYAAADAALQAAMAHAATASHQLAAHEAALIAQQATLARAKVVEAELRIVEDIAKLIGTNDGAGFEKIVQALNLQSLLVRANARLARFLDRYQLEQIVEHRGAPRLDFRVVDLHQSGVRRTIKSLSGGESFIVSMALALGLADLRSSKLSIETLLIDEGFGTVDPSTLKDIVKVLEALRDESGTQIGVISHVEAMREMVPAQIEVKSVGVGRSTLVLHC
jgi:exonuclease SbcC